MCNDAWWDPQGVVCDVSEETGRQNLLTAVCAPSLHDTMAVPD